MRSPSCNKRLNTTQGLRQHHAQVHANRSLTGRGRTADPPSTIPRHSERFVPTAIRTVVGTTGTGAGRRNSRHVSGVGMSLNTPPRTKPASTVRRAYKRATSSSGIPNVKEAERVTKSCEQCGEKMNVLQSELNRGRGKFCCRACLATWLSENVIGKDHHQWAGGDLNYGHGWWAVRRRALERDEH